MKILQIYIYQDQRLHISVSRMTLSTGSLERKSFVNVYQES